MKNNLEHLARSRRARGVRGRGGPPLDRPTDRPRGISRAERNVRDSSLVAQMARLAAGTAAGTAAGAADFLLYATFDTKQATCPIATVQSGETWICCTYKSQNPEFAA